MSGPAAEDGFSADQVEAARVLFARPVSFVMGAAAMGFRKTLD